MPYTLAELNAAPLPEAEKMLAGLYEHSPWIAQQALQSRPFQSLAQLKYAMVKVLDAAGEAPQLALIRAHPELAGKAMVSKTLTAESTNEQSKAGLTDCTPQEFAHIQQLNSDYNTKFGFPFILAVRGPRGVGLSKGEIIATFARRLGNTRSFELAECLRNIHRIVEIRLNDKFGVEPQAGNEIYDWHEDLAQFTDADYQGTGQLTVTYLTAAHQACARLLQAQMLDCGFDEAVIDAVGNVVGRYAGATENAKYLMTGSHYDTVRNGGKYDGRLGIYVPMRVVKTLASQGRRLPFGLEVIGFAEEEGQRYKATFLASSAVIGQFDNDWLAQQDAQGITMREAMQAAGLNPSDIPNLARKPSDYLGFVEVHIEQGPVLNEMNLPLGVVSSINGSERYLGEINGTASHAGTTPMNRRIDAALAAAEIALCLERRALADEGSVATMGQLSVANGSINVVPGKVKFSLDMRAPNDAQLANLVRDVLNEIDAIAARRGVSVALDKTVSAKAAPSNQAWQARWEKALGDLGVPLHILPSGAGHDAMKIHEALPQAMLFVRGLNSGISHNPLESSTNDDIQLAYEAVLQLIENLAQAY